MTRPLLGRRAASLALLLTLVAAPAAATPAEASTPVASTSPTEIRRVDAVRTPVLDWQPCDLGECATASLPLDYDEPAGRQIEVALTRIKARVPSQRIGSLFMNPGGPGQSGTEFPRRALAWLGDDVQDRFDLVGMDPRGVSRSTTSRCFPTVGRMENVTTPLLGMVFPVSPSEERTFTQYSKALGEACSGHGREMAGAMSTAQVARDMDVLRRAVGDQRLSYLGFSYGTYLGQVYANMFPDRVRAVAIDGVVDPRAWVGTPQTADVPATVRMNVAPASSAALANALAACAGAGEACPLSDPAATFARVTDRLLAAPLAVDDPENGSWQLRYQDFLSTVLFTLYTEQGGEEVAHLTAMVDAMQAPSATPAQRRSAALSFRKTSQRATSRAMAKGVATPYDNTVEQVPIIMCSDSRNPKRADTWASLADVEDARAPYFGRYWLWGSVHCAGQHWKALDEDAYAGPFDKVTSAPILVVGNRHDPATSYQAAVDVAQLIPRSRLLSSTNWGHTAYGESACATAHVDRYLVAGTLPAAGTWCTDGREPFRG